MGAVDENATGVERGRDPRFRLVVRHGQVKVDPVALRTGCVHLLEPHGRQLPRLVDKRTGRSLIPRLGDVGAAPTVFPAPVSICTSDPRCAV